MKKTTLWIVISIVCSLFFVTCSNTELPIKFISNEQLKTIKADYKGVPLKGDKFAGKYNSDPDNTRRFQLWKWLIHSNPKKEIKEKENFSMKVHSLASLPQDHRDYLLWIGHATFILKLNDKIILIDPVWTKPPLYDRLTTPPIALKQVKPDYLLVSHGHPDHLDEDTIENMQGDPLALVPLKMGDLIRKWSPDIKVQEAGWYQQYQINEEFEIFFLPAYHIYKRNLWDANEVLWGSYLIRYKDRIIYFAGDTGYSDHFKEIQEIFGPIDIAIISIAAYDPAFVMKEVHTTPEETIRAKFDLQAKLLIPMHYGTFDLSDEPMGEPLQRLYKSADEHKINDELKVLEIGEFYYF